MMRISTTQLWVHDQDEALAFWTDKVGFEVREDVTVPEMGNFRWLSVAPPYQDDIALVLMAIPGPPMIDASVQAKIAEQNEVIREQQVQIQEQQQRIGELENKLSELTASEAEKNDIMAKLAELVEQ